MTGKNGKINGATTHHNPRPPQYTTAGMIALAEEYIRNMKTSEGINQQARERWHSLGKDDRLLETYLFQADIVIGRIRKRAEALIESARRIENTPDNGGQINQVVPELYRFAKDVIPEQQELHEIKERIIGRLAIHLAKKE